jgi:hypothetical protein
VLQIQLYHISDMMHKSECLWLDALLQAASRAISDREAGQKLVCKYLGPRTMVRDASR